MANSVDPDEVAHYEPPHLDLRCLRIQLSLVLVLKMVIILQLYITFLMLFLVIFEGNKNGIFVRENIPFRQGNNFFRTF